MIEIPIFPGDDLDSLVRAFLVWLHEHHRIHISNSVEGEAKTERIVRILEE